MKYRVKVMSPVIKAKINDTQKVNYGISKNSIHSTVERKYIGIPAFMRHTKFTEVSSYKNENIEENLRNFGNLEIWKTPKEKKKYIDDDYTRVHIIHWWFRNRQKMELTDFEKFHFSMLYLADFNNKFDEIHFTVALDIDSEEQKDFVREKIKELTQYGRAKVTLSFIMNSKTQELNTFIKIFNYLYDDSKKYIVFYSHFKGVKHSNPKGILNIKYWCYLMYQGCLIDGWQDAMQTLNTSVVYGALKQERNARYADTSIDSFRKCSIFKNIEYPDYFYTGSFYFVNAYNAHSSMPNNYDGKIMLSTDNHSLSYVEYVLPALFKCELPAFFDICMNLTDKMPYKVYDNHIMPEYLVRFKKIYKDSIRFKSATYRNICYTVITGNYDTLMSPTIISEGWRYICFSDKDIKSDIWDIFPIPDELKDCNLSQVKIQRLLKILPHKYLPDHDISIYVDANIKITSNLSIFIKDICYDKDFWVAKHGRRNCIYKEVEAVISSKRDKYSNIEKQILRYKSDKFPKNFGLNETGILVRKNKGEIIKIDELWANEVINGSHRDQLSFNYCLWKLNYKIDNNITISNLCSKGYFEMRKHQKNTYPDLYKTNKYAIVAIAKNEDRYLDEWIDYHLNLGFHHIYIYDNNDTLTDKLKEISKKENVTVIDIRGREALKRIGHQPGCYKDAYFKYGNDYDWIAFFDIDEFLVLDNNNLTDFLGSFKDADEIHINWKCYGDNDKIEYESSPVIERFKESASKDVCYSQQFSENMHVKQILKTRLHFTEFTPHTSSFDGIICYHCSSEIDDAKKSIRRINWTNAHINHYNTKSLEEYLTKRCKTNLTANTDNGPSIKDRLRWYFNENKYSIEKRDFINKFCRDNNINFQFDNIKDLQ